MNREKSIKLQKKAGTWHRNELIRFFDQQGLGPTVMGRKFGVTKQRAAQIIKQPGSNNTGKRKGLWERLKALIFRE